MSMAQVEGTGMKLCTYQAPKNSALKAELEMYVQPSMVNHIKLMGKAKQC